MSFTMLYVEAIGIVTARVRYVSSGAFTSYRVLLSERTVRWNSSLSSLSEKTRESNHLQMSE